MSFWKQTQVIDDLNGLARCTESNELRTVQAIRLAGQGFRGSTVDPNFWTSTVVGTGTVTQSNGLQILSTGVTANSSAKAVSTDISRFIGHNENEYTGIVVFGDTGTANNTRRWGAFNGTDGAYFKLSGTTLSVCTMTGGVETAVASGSWNGNQTVPTLTNLNMYRIQYQANLVIFFINGVVAHTLTATSLWSSNMNLPILHDNVNSGGSTTNVTMSLASAVIYRLGPVETQPKYFHGTTAATTVLKYSTGTLHRICLNTSPSTSAQTVTVYDNTAGSGTVIAVYTGQSNVQGGSIEYHLTFNNGLTVVSTGTWDYTVVYQ